MNVALVFTMGMSVEQWERQGLLDREKLIYEQLLASGAVERFFWFTYGPNDPQYASKLAPGITIVPMPGLFRGRIGYLAYSFLMPFLQAKAFGRVDIIKTNQMKGAWSALIAAKLFVKKFYLRTGFTWSLLADMRTKKSVMDRLASLIEKICYHFADTAAVTSAHQKEYLVARYNVASDKLAIVPNYVDIGKFFPTQAAELENRIVHVGRLHEEKNLVNLISAVGNTPWTLDLYYGDGGIKSELEALARAKNASVSFKGAVSNNELPRLLNQYPVFVLASLRENMPKALVEAMACGRAVLGTNVPGINELISHGQNGWLVGTSADELRAGLTILMNDAALRKRLGQDAAAFARANFSMAAILQKEQKRYDALLRR